MPDCPQRCRPKMTPREKDRAKEKDPDGREKLKAKDRSKEKDPDGRTHDLLGILLGGTARSVTALVLR